MTNATIWKYVWPIPNDRAAFDMPKGAEVLFVAQQHEQICLWARVDPNAEKESRPFVLCGTGHPVPSPINGRYLGSALLHGGSLVLHVFEPPPCAS